MLAAARHKAHRGPHQRRQPARVRLPGDVGDVATRRAKLGYGDDVRLEEGADLGLGCGNPLQAAKLRPGEVVLDLGSGAGVRRCANTKAG